MDWLMVGRWAGGCLFALMTVLTLLAAGYCVLTWHGPWRRALWPVLRWLADAAVYATATLGALGWHRHLFVLLIVLVVLLSARWIVGRRLPDESGPREQRWVDLQSELLR